MWRKAMLLAALVAAHPAAAQNRPEPDRSDPAILERELERPEADRPPQTEPNVAASARPKPGLSAGEVVVGAIQVRGTSRLRAAAFGPAIEPFLARPLGHDDLVQLATAVANVARRSGFGLATAWVPSQELTGGVLIVQVDEGRIDGVEVEGPGSDLVERQLAGFISPTPVATAELERQLLLAGDISGVQLGEARLVHQGGRNILVVDSKYRRVTGRASIDNWGSDSVGPIRAWAEVTGNGVVRRGDDLTLGVAITPLEPNTFQLLEAHYRLPLGGRGTTMSFGGYFGRTDVEPSERGSGYRGDSWEVELEATHPLERSRARSLWLTGRLEVRDSMLEREGKLVRDDRITSASINLHGYERFAGGRVRARATLTQGLDLFDATRAGDPLASRLNASGVFTKFETYGEFYRRFAGGFSTLVALKAQLADGPLLSSEEMGLGGPQFLRAFDYRELSGDQGAAASAELRFNLNGNSQDIDNIQFYGYADVGEVVNLGGRGRSGSLASAGGGIRFTLAKRWDAGIELGVPLTDGDEDRNPKPRLSFSLRTRF